MKYVLIVLIVIAMSSGIAGKATAGQSKNSWEAGVGTAMGVGDFRDEARAGVLYNLGYFRRISSDWSWGFRLNYMDFSKGKGGAKHEVKTTIFSGDVLAKLKFASIGRASPYIKAGLSQFLVNKRLDRETAEKLVTSAHNYTAKIGWPIYAGLELPMKKGWDLNPELRFLHISGSEKAVAAVVSVSR